MEADSGNPTEGGALLLAGRGCLLGFSRLGRTPSHSEGDEDQLVNPSLVSLVLNVSQRSLTGEGARLRKLGQAWTQCPFHRSSPVLQSVFAFASPAEAPGLSIPEPLKALQFRVPGWALLDVGLLPLLTEWRKQFPFYWFIIFLPSDIWWVHFLLSEASSPTP